MSQVLDGAGFSLWFGASLPGFAAMQPAGLFNPAVVRDRGDPQIVHLDGLNLARAWCFAGLASAVTDDAAARAAAGAAARRHLEAGMQGIASADYAGAHWLASFATLALTEYDLPA